MKPTSRISNLFAVCKGLLAVDHRLTSPRRIVQVISRFTWELPTTIAGLLTTLGSVIMYNATIRHHHGATYVRLSHGADARCYWAFTLGTYIVGSQHSMPLLQHEYGHYLQSRTYGPLYLLVIALPSLLSAAFDHNNHKHRWFEKDADRRSASYFA